MIATEERVSAPVLEARTIVKDYPGVRALDGVDFELETGEIHALLGENGAGKSTLVNVLTGVVQPDDGEVRIAGTPVELASPRDAADRGISVIHQDIALAPDLSVATTISLGDIPIRPGGLPRLLGVIDQRAIEDRAERALGLVGHTVRAHARAGSLSVAQAQLLQIARALTSPNLNTLLLDEPTASLSPIERDELFAHLRRLKSRGIGILYISHRLEEVVQIADRATILRDGRVVGTLRGEQLTVDRVAGLMLGASKVLAATESAKPPGEPLLEVENLTREPVFRNVSLTVRAGEIVGLTGLVGAGRTEVARCIFGADRPQAGVIRVRGREVDIDSPKDAIDLGIAFATEDRKSQGIFFWLPIRENIIVASLSRDETVGRLVRWGQVLRRATIDRIASGVIQRLGIRPPTPSAQAGTMSGGNQQKVILGRWLTSEAPILLLDEPTRGVDVGAKGDIWQLVRGLADSGTAILTISSEVPELIAHADRILVMKSGTIVGELAQERATEEEVMLLAGGRN